MRHHVVALQPQRDLLDARRLGDAQAAAHALVDRWASVSDGAEGAIVDDMSDLHTTGPFDVRATYADMDAARRGLEAVSYTHLRAHETDSYLVCRLLLEKKQ